MLKKLVIFLAGAAMMVGFAAGSALALPTLPTGYSWNQAAFWNFTDWTTSNSGFEIRLENAAYESDFGLFTVDSNGNLLNKFQVFSYLNNPDDEAVVFLKYEAGTLMVSLQKEGTYYTLGETFGFYYDVHTGGATDPIADYSYYTLNTLNTPASEVGVDHILTATAEGARAIIYLDDQLFANADRDFTDMTVKANDVAPVPEPGTMVLLGAGMLGLAIFGKRRMNREA